MNEKKGLAEKSNELFLIYFSVLAGRTGHKVQSLPGQVLLLKGVYDYQKNQVLLALQGGGDLKLHPRMSKFLRSETQWGLMSTEEKTDLLSKFFRGYVPRSG